MSARPSRPLSASQARYAQLETISFPMQTGVESSSESCQACISPRLPANPEGEAVEPLEMDTTALQTKFQALLEMWEDEQRSFRSPALFCETIFTQVKALVGSLPRPNRFLSAVAFACLDQMGCLMEKQYPFLLQAINELGAALYCNFTELQSEMDPPEQSKNHCVLFFERGKPWFQELAAQKHRVQSLRAATQASKDEVRLLTEMLREARAVTAAPTAISMPRTPSKREKVNDSDHHAAFQLRHLDCQSASDEVLQTFAALPDKDARQVLSRLIQSAEHRRLPKLGETLAETLGRLEEGERREFLRECFDSVSSNELQTALHDRGETNDDKCYQMLLDDLSELLQLQPQEETREIKVTAITQRVLFHSEEAQIKKKIHELVDLVEDLAVEVALLAPKHSALLPEALRQRLRGYECPLKRMDRTREMMMYGDQRAELEAEEPKCECVCGKHWLMDDTDDGEDDHHRKASATQSSVQQAEPQEDDRKARKPRRSTLKRPLSAPSGRRKNAINFGSRLGSPRHSNASIHIFPLAEVCHLSTAILHLQFSRNAIELPSNGGGGAVSMLSGDDRWAFLRRDAAPETFKTLAKDYLVRKYGIKSIAVMHMLQLERSLIHYSVKESHVRCELFGWFFGADKARVQSKDFAFAFFQKLVKSLLSLLSMKKAGRSNSISSAAVIPVTQQPLAYSTLISLWTAFIGDGETAGARSVPTSIALEACKLAFPTAMHQSIEYLTLREKLYRRGLEQQAAELEAFFRETMQVWQRVFDGQMLEISRSLESSGVLDLDGFARCLIANDLEFTTGERYELFDLLTLENDATVIPSKKLVQLVMEVKYLRPGTAPGALAIR
ncbi:hypothetical protein BBJ28_00015315 [Nothophytophthora sp. Chile5]|nr:hypothetical protein BBJ28_00015315 [Nothophytophthora sp. Chile5]